MSVTVAPKVFPTLAVTHFILTWSQVYILQDFQLLFNIIFLMTSHFISLSSSSALPPEQIMAQQTHQEGTSGSESSKMMGASSTTWPTETQLQCRHHIVQGDAANAATKNMTQHAEFKMFRKTRCSNDEKQHLIRYEYIHSEVDVRQLTIWHTAGVCRELHDKFIGTSTRKPGWSTKALICTVRTIKHHQVGGCGFFGPKSSEKRPRG